MTTRKLSSFEKSLDRLDEIIKYKKSLKTEARRHVRAAEKEGKIFFLGMKNSYIDHYVFNKTVVDKSKAIDLDINKYCYKPAEI